MRNNILFLLLLLVFSSARTQTLNMALGKVVMDKGDINTEIIIRMIARKQFEARSELAERVVLRSLRKGNFATFNYAKQGLDIAFAPTKPANMTQQYLKISSELLWVYLVTELYLQKSRIESSEFYCFYDSSFVNNEILKNMPILLSSSVDYPKSSKCRHFEKIGEYDGKDSKDIIPPYVIRNVLIDKVFDLLMQDSTLKSKGYFTQTLVEDEYKSLNQYWRLSLVNPGSKLITRINSIEPDLKKFIQDINAFSGTKTSAEMVIKLCPSHQKDAKMEAICKEFLTLLQYEEAVSYEKLLAFLPQFSGQYVDEKTQYVLNFIFNTVKDNFRIDSTHKQISINVEGVTTRLYENFGEHLTPRVGVYFGMGVNYAIPIFNRDLIKETSYAYYASEKLGIKVNIYDWNHRRMYGKYMNHLRSISNYSSRKFPTYKINNIARRAAKSGQTAFVTGWYAYAYGSGLLYKIEKLNSNHKNFDQPLLGVGTGITLFNGLDVNCALASPPSFLVSGFSATPIYFNFGFDVRISEYLSELWKK